MHWKVQSCAAFNAYNPDVLVYLLYTWHNRIGSFHYKSLLLWLQLQFTGVLFTFSVFEYMKQHFMQHKRSASLVKWITEHKPLRFRSVSRRNDVINKCHRTTLSLYETLCPPAVGGDHNATDGRWQKERWPLLENCLRVSAAHTVKLVAFSLQHPSFSHSPRSGRTARH